MMGQFFFFTRILARVQNSSLDLEGCYFVFWFIFNPQDTKAQSKNRKIDEETLVSRKVYLFHTEFSPGSVGLANLNTSYSFGKKDQFSLEHRSCIKLPIFALAVTLSVSCIN